MLNLNITFFILPLIIVSIMLLNGCSSDNVKIETWWMDSKLTKDESLIPGSDLLVSNWKAPSDAEKNNRHIVMTIHGYTGSTHEWLEFKEYAYSNRRKDSIGVSLILLGGHGRDYYAFKASGWREWGKPILEEYDKLKKLGYKHISIVASSTGGALVIKYLNEGHMSDLDHLFFIDTIVVPQNKMLYLSPYLKFFIGNKRSKYESKEKEENSYQIMPKDTLSELAKLIKSVKKDLKNTVQINPEATISIFQSQNDPTVDPARPTPKRVYL